MIDSVHDVTVAYRNGEIPESELMFLNGALPDEIHFYLDTFHLSDIFKSEQQVDDNQELENWLNERWSHKERFLKWYWVLTFFLILIL